MQLVFASRNPDKIAELKDALKSLPLEVRSAAEFPDVPEVEETGTTLEANALLKARAVHQVTQCLCLADDTGLEVEALGGAPGVHSARYGGSEQSYEKNLAKLLEALHGVPTVQRGARFRTIVAIVFPEGAEVVVEGICAGRILSQRMGSGGFGYDPVFHIPEAGKTFAEMSLTEKQRISHRGQAMREVCVILEEWLRTSGKR